jgi:hypothetical protein
MYEGVDTVVFQDELAIEDELPFVWRPISLPLSPATQSHYSEGNARILQVCMALDDQTPAKKVDDPPQAAELERLDLKLNLLLDLVGRLLLQNQPRPSPARVRFNARGAVWKFNGAVAAAKLGESGIFEVYLHNCLVEPLRLCGCVHRADQSGVEVRFDRGPEIVGNLIDKFTFRRHRRRVADVRGAKR